MSNTHSLDLELDSTQYAYCVDNANVSPTGDFTLEACVKFESLPASGNTMFFIAKDDPSLGTKRSYSFVLYNNAGTLQLYTEIFQTSDPTLIYISGSINWTPSTGIWYRVSMTFDVSGGSGAQVEMFIDGSSIGYLSGETDLTSVQDSTAPFEIGRRYDAIGYVDGLIDDVRLFNDIRTPAEIADAKDRELTAAEIADANTKGYWKLNNNYNDEVGVSNLTAVNNPVFSTDVPFVGATTTSTSTTTTTSSSTSTTTTSTSTSTSTSSSTSTTTSTSTSVTTTSTSTTTTLLPVPRWIKVEKVNLKLKVDHPGS